MLAGLLFGPVSRIEGPVAVKFLDGLAPLALVACALAVIAFTKYHDHGLLLLVPLVAGVVFIVTPIAFLIAGGST